MLQTLVHDVHVQQMVLQSQQTLLLTTESVAPVELDDMMVFVGYQDPRPSGLGRPGILQHFVNWQSGSAPCGVHPCFKKKEKCKKNCKTESVKKCKFQLKKLFFFLSVKQ